MELPSTVWKGFPMAKREARAALPVTGGPCPSFADALSVDHIRLSSYHAKDRTPHRTTVIAAANLLPRGSA